ncbi:unnamed protein product, partial [Mesorhabditis belari]|uniref:Large ribosomal subunit protein bL9m n=1 Tax=Mesorhabditis belari TaxID=2138241 RepID=A0AAF3J7S8_9BILA
MLARQALQRVRGLHRTARQATWILQRVWVPDPTPEGAVQRDPRELPNTQRLEVVEQEPTTPTGNIELILMEDVEGVGHQFDVVMVETDYARTELLPTRKAVYASPFDLKYYGDMKEKMKDELASRVRIPYEYLVVGRQLQKMVVPIKISMDNKWELNSTVIKASLRQIGVDILDDAIYVPSDPPITGPNFELEAHLIRFYIVVCKQFVVPMIGIIEHVSSDASKKIITLETSKFPSTSELEKYGLRPEECYYHKKAEIEKDFDVFGLMKLRK